MRLPSCSRASCSWSAVALICLYVLTRTFFSYCIQLSQKELSQAHLPVQVHAFIDRHCSIAGTFETQARLLHGFGVKAVESGGETIREAVAVTTPRTVTPVVGGKLESQGDVGAMTPSGTTWRQFAESRSETCALRLGLCQSLLPLAFKPTNPS